MKMTLVPEGYPDRKQGDDEVKTSKKLIRGYILDLPEGVLAPTLIYT